MLVLMFVVALPHVAEAGKCIQPPKGGTAFCSIEYQVYVASDTASNDTDYWCGSAGRSCRSLLLAAQPFFGPARDLDALPPAQV